MTKDDLLRRAKQCEDYAETHRKDRQELSEQFHRGAAMAFKDMANMLGEGQPGCERCVELRQMLKNYQEMYRETQETLRTLGGATSPDARPTDVEQGKA